MKKIILVLMALFVLVLIVGCQSKQVIEETSQTAGSTEEAEMNDALDELNEFEELGSELEEDISFDDLENLEFE